MSNLVEHAKRELALLGETDEEYITSIVKVMEAFTSYGHSGGSASAAIPTICDLLQFKALTPLTNNPAEWNEVGDGIWQSIRNSEAFSTDGGVSYYLVSELTPYYESDQYHEVETSAVGEAGSIAPEPPKATSAPVSEGDTIVPVNVVSDQ